MSRSCRVWESENKLTGSGDIPLHAMKKIEIFWKRRGYKVSWGQTSNSGKSIRIRYTPIHKNSPEESQ